MYLFLKEAEKETAVPNKQRYSESGPLDLHPMEASSAGRLVRVVVLVW